MKKYYGLFLVLLFISCTNIRPKKECITFNEANDPVKDSLSWESLKEEGLKASFVSIDSKYSKSVMPALTTLEYQQKVEGWKGERVSAQILLWSKTDVSQVEFEFNDFKSIKEKLPGSIAQARFVRYVLTDEFGKGCGYRTIDDYPSSLAPDMLDSLDCFNVEAYTVRPVWITLDIPHSAQEGVYTGTIDLYADGEKIQELLLEVDVINQVLPKASEWSIHLDLWQHPAAVARIHNLELWSEAHFKKMKPLMQKLADLGQKVITTTINKDPWDNQCYDAYADMITWTKQEDGTWIYDYTVFDKWVQFMMNLGVDKMINCYSMAPWNNELHYFDEATEVVIDVKADPETKLFTDMWVPFLKDFVKHLDSKGWLEITNMAMDERKPKEMEIILSTLNQFAPQLGVAFADNQHSYKKYPNITEISVSADMKVDIQDIEARRQKGLVTTYYVCCSDEFPNVFTFSDAAEATYLFWYAASADYDGFLRWAYNSWVENPIMDSRFRTWPAGDTYLVYPDARSSIRYERMLEGAQDFEKIRILKQKMKDNGDTINHMKLKEAIEKLNSNKRTETWNSDLNRAKIVLNELSRIF